MEKTSLQNYLSPQAYRSLQVEKLKRLRTDTDEWMRYAVDPVAFVYDIFTFLNDEHLAPYQENALNKLVENSRVCIRGPHGLGKTALMALTILWFSCTHPFDTKIPTTASAWRQLEKFLWPEIHKWFRLADWNKWQRMGGIVPEMFSLKMKVGDGCEAFALASDNEALIEGAHGSNLLYAFDESKAVPDKTWDAAEGAFATGDAFWIACSTPGPRSGRFYDIQRHAPGFEDWHVIHVTLDEAIEAGRIKADWAKARLRQWGEDSPVYQARVLGEFPEQSEDSLISLVWIEAARNVELEETDKKRAGCDIARFGSDDSAIMLRNGPVVFHGEFWHGNDTMQSAGKIKAKNYPAHVDVIGIGAGVVDRLDEQGFPVHGVNVAESPLDKEHFQTLRDELHWNLRELFKDGEIDLTRLPQNIYDRLSGELTSIKYKYTSKGQIKIESKLEMKKRIGRSPDVADALMLCFAPDPPTAKVQRLVG